MKKVFAVILVTSLCCSILCSCDLSGCAHTYNPATCAEPQTCSQCGKTKGSALEHTYNDATCAEPQTCSQCGETKGSALEHTYSVATCTEPQTCSQCGKTKGSALGHTTTTGTCTRCGKKFGNFTVKYYVDEFKQPTSEAYVQNITHIQGTFSNSATSNSKLYVDLLVDADNIAFVLLEYGTYRVKNSSSRYVDEYSIVMMTADGTKYNLTGTVYCGGDRLIIDAGYKATVLNALKKSSEVAFYIVEDDRTTTEYLFSIKTSNFAEQYKKITG